jgi:predicted RNA-binding protein with PIN domain
MQRAAMRWLIDGYNVMHAAGLLGPKLSREGFRRARRRFLDGLADALPVEREGDVTVVFDASVPPGDFPLSSTYRGIRVVFALGDEDADSRIEYMLGHDSNPKSLTVVSSDNRIRQAASRRRARPLTADAFWDLKDEMSTVPTLRTDHPPEIERDATPGAKETEFWLEAFREVENVPGVHDVVSPNAALLTDAEIAEIQRLIDRET